jgi:hypothetical protein
MGVGQRDGQFSLPVVESRLLAGKQGSPLCGKEGLRFFDQLVGHVLPKKYSTAEIAESAGANNPTFK